MYNANFYLIKLQLKLQITFALVYYNFIYLPGLKRSVHVKKPP